MKTYNAKTLIEGYKLGLDKNKLYIAIPDKIYSSNILITHGNQMMQLNGDKPLKVSESFDDKFGRQNPYCLYYFLWKPTQEIQMEVL